MPTSLPPKMQYEDALLSDELIGRLYQAGEAKVGPLVAHLADRERGRLAIFCYGRAHLRSIGFAIAATCELGTLVDIAGHAGEIIYAQSRETSPAVAEEGHSGKRKITLATSILRTFASLDEDEPEGEAEAERTDFDAPAIAGFEDMVPA